MPRPYRLLMWFIAAFGGLGLVVAFGGLRRLVAPVIGAYGAAGFGASVLLAAAFGLLGHRAARAGRERNADAELNTMLLAQLGPQDNATLERIGRTRGPAGEAARRILMGRRAKKNE